MSDRSEQVHRGKETAPEGARYFYSLDRFNAFSDGVFAIAITLLVLDLPVPPENAPTLPALLTAWPEFLGYCVSFAFIGSIWLTHSALTRAMKRADAVVHSMNLLVLLFVALLPFSTKIVVADLDAPDLQVAVLLYGLDFLLASLVLSLLMSYVVRDTALLVDNITHEEALGLLYRWRWAPIGLTVLALATAFVAPRVAVGLYIITTALLLVLPLVVMRWPRRRSGAA